MENITIIPKNEKQFSAIKTFLEEMKIRFKTEKEDDTLMTEEEFYVKIDRAKQQAKEGKGTLIKTKEELHSHFDSL